MDQARRRGGGWARVDLESALMVGPGELERVLSVDQLLARLYEHDPRLETVVQMRVFGGLTDAEIAVEPGVSDRWVRTLWGRARRWLRGQMAG